MESGFSFTNSPETLKSVLKVNGVAMTALVLNAPMAALAVCAVNGFTG